MTTSAVPPALPHIYDTVPVLRSFDEKRAREFYVDWLGFNVDWEHRFEPKLPLYMQLSRHGLTLHLSEHHGDACPGAAVFIRMRGLVAFHADITSRPYDFYRPAIERLPWGLDQMSITDPFGNSLRFTEEVPEPPAA